MFVNKIFFRKYQRLSLMMSKSFLNFKIITTIINEIYIVADWLRDIAIEGDFY